MTSNAEINLHRRSCIRSVSRLRTGAFREQYLIGALCRSPDLRKGLGRATDRECNYGQYSPQSRQTENCTANPPVQLGSAIDTRSSAVHIE